MKNYIPIFACEYIISKPIYPYSVYSKQHDDRPEAFSRRKSLQAIRLGSIYICIKSLWFQKRKLRARYSCPRKKCLSLSFSPGGQRSLILQLEPHKIPGGLAYTAARDNQQQLLSGSRKMEEKKITGRPLSLSSSSSLSPYREHRPLFIFQSVGEARSKPSHDWLMRV